MAHNDPKAQPGGAREGSESDEDRSAILERRRRFIAAAMMGLASASLGAACRPQPCLEPPYIPTDAATDAPDDTRPTPCLSVEPIDAGSDADPSDAGPKDSTTDDAAPLPCLSPPPPDSGSD